MYCPECGSQLDNDMLFCPECGTKVEKPSAKDSEDPVMKGILFTHIPNLAQKLSVSPQEITNLLETFIRLKSEQGVLYRLADAGVESKGFFNKRKSLTPDSPWYEYADLLKQIHDQETRNHEEPSTFLFIIGGDDIIPMPAIPHYLGNEASDADKKIDTDILYAYPYGAQMNEAICSGQLFFYDALFYIGRLPLATDAVFQDLADYLQRTIENPVIDIHAGYGQCDPHWMKVTAKVTNRINKEQLFPKYNPLPKGILYDQLFLTPEVDHTNIGQVFNTNAQLFFFNLHGSAAKETFYFLGQSTKDSSDWRVAIYPGVLAACKHPNVVVSEACYGARFIGFDKAHSMLLTAMSANTLIYLGASRVAYGQPDPHDPSNPVQMSNADVITGAFVNNMLDGLPAGAAFFEARRYLHQVSEIGPIESTTLVEFNLFGDPTLFIMNSKMNKAPAPTIDAKIGTLFTPTAASSKLENVPVSMEEEAKPVSLLAQVRAQVDANIAEIQSKINDQLYKQWGISPRKPISMSRTTSLGGQKGYEIQYDLDDHKKAPEGFYNLLSVSSDLNGKIRSVRVTK